MLSLGFDLQVQLLARLSGLLIDQLHVKTEVIDLAGALREAQNRVINITHSAYSPMPTSKADEAQPFHVPVPDLFGD